VLSIAIPNAAEKVLDDFIENLKIRGEIPQTTKLLMSEAINNKIQQLKSIELGLKKLLEDVMK
jgi:hypothetical protein